MKIYRKIIHPYRQMHDKSCQIDEYKNRWFSKESKHEIMNEIYKNHAKPGENRIKFFRRFSLKWQEKFVEVHFASDMDDKIENLTDNTIQNSR